MDEVSVRRRGRSKKNSAGNQPDWVQMVEDAIAGGTMKPHCRAAALAIARQIARLEAHFEQTYAADGSTASEPNPKPYSVGMLEQMGRAEKHLADL
jgi:DNA primase